MRAIGYKRHLRAIFNLIDKFDLLAALILSFTLCAAIGLGAGKISASAVLSVLAIVLFCLITGRAVSNLLSLPLPLSARFPAAILLGSAGISVLMLLICLAARVSAGTAFLITCGGSLVLVVVTSVSRRSQQLYQNPGPGVFVPALVSAICGASLVWSWQAIRSYPRIAADGFFFAWTDFFFHSRAIVQFAHFSALRGSFIYSAGDNVPLYHWASYLLPAVVCTFSDTPALVIATTMWVLFGYIVMGLGAWALGAVLADWKGGVVALAFILLLPSAAHYGFRNPFFDFPWILQISASLSFGIGFSLLALALCIEGLRHHNRLAIGAAAALAVAESLFKMHFFATLLPAFAFFVAISWPWRQPRRRAFSLAALAASALLFAALAEKVERAPHFFSGPHEVSKILTIMLTQEPAAAPLLFPKLRAAEPAAIAVPAGIVLLLGEAFGVLLPAYLLGWLYCSRRNLSRPEDCLPAIIVVAYCLVNLIFPTLTSFTGSLEEYQHRNYVLIYAVLAVWCAYFTVILVSQWWPRRARFIFTVGICLLLPFPFLLQSKTQVNRMSWGKIQAVIPMPEGLVKSALFIRASGSPRDITLSSDSNADEALGSLSERLAPPLARHVAIAGQLRRARTYQEMLAVAKAEAVEWYVVTPSTPLAPDVQSKAAMCSGGYCVFHLGKGSGD